jgi:hypothetical protein
VTVRQTEDGKHCNSETFTLVFQLRRLIPGTPRAGVARISGIAALRAEPSWRGTVTPYPVKTSPTKSSVR